MHPQTIALPLFDVRAAVGTVNDVDRTIEVTFSTGAGVERYDWVRGERYLEKLSLDPTHVRLERLNSGAPVLDTHTGWSVKSILGAVVEGSASILNKKDARATLRFSKRDDVTPVWQDVVDRIVKFVSIGYRTHKYEEERGKGALPVRTAIDWEPYEISMVPMPADAGSKTRGEQHIESFPCVIVTRGLVHPSNADADRLRRLQLARAAAR